MKKTILLTGCNGFIGRGFINEFGDKYEIIGIDIQKNFGESLCNKEYNFDICNEEEMRRVFLNHKIDVVLHTAAEKSLIKCEKNKKRAYNINYVATIKLAQLAKENGSHFIFISSDQVFNGNKPYSKETDDVGAINYYGELKILIERELGEINNTSICRTALVFGDIPKEQIEYFDSVKSEKELAVQGYIVQQTRYCLKNGIVINLPNDEFVSPTHVKLLASQLNLVIENRITGILHCCGNDRISRYDMGVAIANKYGLQIDYIDSSSSNNVLRPKDVSLDCRYTEKILRCNFPNFSEMLEIYM